MQIGAAASLVVTDSYAVYEIGEDGGRTLVADGLKPADVLADGIDVTVNDTAAHRYEVVGSANVPEGADAVTVTYTATLAAVEEPEPGPDPDPTPDPSESRTVTVPVTALAPVPATCRSRPRTLWRKPVRMCSVFLPQWRCCSRQAV